MGESDTGKGGLGVLSLSLIVPGVHQVVAVARRPYYLQLRREALAPSCTDWQPTKGPRIEEEVVRYVHGLIDKAPRGDS